VFRWNPDERGNGITNLQLDGDGPLSKSKWIEITGARKPKSEPEHHDILCSAECKLVRLVLSI
jgi:hypothetical protein